MLARTSTPLGLSEDCPTREVLDRVGDKWSVLAIVLLGQRTHRFNELHRSIEGISRRMLTLTVRALERDGLVSRTVHAGVPPRVDYELTELSRSLLDPLNALNAWANAHRGDIQAAREQHDHRTVWSQYLSGAIRAGREGSASTGGRPSRRRRRGGTLRARPGSPSPVLAR
ncbi:MAG TPA: helix-turn-helix domain-containing protein [Streptosporangiaceae bacterium]|nr:helix-turn-helix domain-containing protein [Streptosporangiaceae bacterium]